MARRTSTPAPIALSAGDSLVVRTHPVGRGDIATRRVYSIPVADLRRYERPNVSPEEHQQLDNFFAKNKKPRVEAARIATMHTFDGSATYMPPDC